MRAQSAGQWWWTATVGLGQRSYENEVDGSRLSEFDQDELNLSFDLNGYIVHPAIARFRIGTELLVANAEGRQTFDSDRFALGADLHLIPYGAFPVRLYGQRSLYDFARTDGNDPFTLAGAPDTSTRWGGEFRVARGALAGLQAGFESETTDFLDPDSDQESRDRSYLNWSRSTGAFRHRLRLERRDRDYGTIDLAIDDVVAQFDERAKLSPTWDWELYGSGLRRDVAAANGVESSTDVYRLRNRFLHIVRLRDVLDFRVEQRGTEFDGGGSSDGQAFSAFYRWRPRPAWEIAPFASYTDQSSGDLSVSSPRVGTAVTWRRAKSALDVVLGGQASYGRVERSGFVDSGKESQLASSLTGSLSHGDASGLRKELEFEVAHDELRLTRDLVAQLPDLGLRPNEIGSEDFYRARVTLGHRWDGAFLDGWGEWHLRESNQDGAIEDFESETLSATVQLGGHGYGVNASLGKTEVRRGLQDDQDVSFAAATAWWRPWRYLNTRTTYRTDERRFLLTEDVRGERWEVGAQLRFGTLLLDAYVYASTDELSGGTERTNRGFNWTVSSRFGGVLPIVTGTKRRGVIR